MGRRLIQGIVILVMIIGGVFSAPAVIAQEASNQELSSEQLGLVDDDTYESPQWGYEVSWDRHWEADPLNMSTSRNQFLDRLSIVGEHGRFQAFYVQSSDEKLSQYRDRFTEYRAKVYDDLQVVAAEESQDDIYTVQMSWTEDGKQVVSILEFSFVDRDFGVMQILELITYPESSEEAFADTQSGVFVGESKPFRIFKEFPAPTALAT